MARETKTKRIGNHNYSVTQLGAIEGRRVLAKLMQLFGGMVGGIAGGGKPDMVAGFAALAGAITPEQVDFFCETFTPWTQVETSPGKVRMLRDVFDDHFVANYGELVEWLGFCLEVNFASFLGGSGIVGSMFRPPGTVSSPSDAQKDGTGNP